MSTRVLVLTVAVSSSPHRCRLDVQVTSSPDTVLSRGRPTPVKFPFPAALKIAMHDVGQSTG